MKQNRAWATSALIAAAIAITPSVTHAQANPTATQQLQLSAFGGGTGTWTGILGGRNLGITAGADLGFMTFHRYRPVLEIRGTFPIHNGQIDSQKNFLGGLKVEREFGPLHPYVNFLVGRGQIDYQRAGLQVGSFVYLYSSSTVFSPGLGVDYDLTDHWSMKADFQYQSWDVPFAMQNGAPAPVSFTTPPGSTSGTIHPRVLTLAAVYRFDFNNHGRRARRVRENYPPPPAPMQEPQYSAPPQPEAPPPAQPDTQAPPPPPPAEPQPMPPPEPAPPSNPPPANSAPAPNQQPISMQ